MIEDETPDDATLAAARDLASRYGAVDPDDVHLVRTLSTTWIALADGVVVKVHPPGTDHRALARRLAVAAHPALRSCVLTPMGDLPLLLTPEGKPPVWATVWPRVEPLAPYAAAAPWREAGALLARLHRTGIPDAGAPDGGLPCQGSVDRLRQALDRLTTAIRLGVPPGLVQAVDAVRAAAARLPAASWAPDGGPGRPRTLVHGDWHLGQLGRLLVSGPDRWRLIDVDDFGAGDPVWDLGRPAAFWAAGLMPDDDWLAFLDGYRADGGPAVPPSPEDPWPVLDPVAQACVVLAAAGAVRRAVPAGRLTDDADQRMVAICSRLPDDSRC